MKKYKSIMIYAVTVLATTIILTVVGNKIFSVLDMQYLNTSYVETFVIVLISTIVFKKVRITRTK